MRKVEWKSLQERREAAAVRDAPWPSCEPDLGRFSFLHAHTREGDRLIKEKPAKKRHWQ